MDTRSMLINLPSGAERELIIQDVGNSDEKFLFLLRYCFA